MLYYCLIIFGCLHITTIVIVIINLNRQQLKLFGSLESWKEDVGQAHASVRFIIEYMWSLIGIVTNPLLLLGLKYLLPSMRWSLFILSSMVQAFYKVIRSWASKKFMTGWWASFLNLCLIFIFRLVLKLIFSYFHRYCLSIVCFRSFFLDYDILCFIFWNRGCSFLIMMFLIYYSFIRV